MDSPQTPPAGGKNQSFAQQNKNTLIAVGIVIILLIIYFTTRGNTQQGTQSDNSSGQATEQQITSGSEENKDEEATTKTDETKKPEEAKTANTSTTEEKKDAMVTPSGNLNITGKLQASDNASKGNLMVATSHGTVYIHTSRDFSGLQDKEVTAKVNGSMTAFTLVDITANNGGTAQAGTDTSAKGGSTEAMPQAPETKPETAMTGDVHFTGKLNKSTDSAKGTYVIVSGKTAVYIQTSKDYTALVGGDVELSATGSLQNFTAAKITKK